MSGRDAVIVLPTGGGKSLCFQVPALLRSGLTLVVSPLISLMVDQVQALQRRGIPAEFLNRMLTAEESAVRLDRLRRGALKLLYLAPERLTSSTVLERLRAARVTLLAVDEAHCVSTWGHDFRPAYLRLRGVREALGTPQTVALTATATPEVRRDIRQLLGLRAPAEVIGGFDRPNLTLSVLDVADEGAREAGLARLLGEREGPAIVYTATRRQVEQVVRILVVRRHPAVAYHAGLGAERRARAQDAFMRGETPIIVATNAFGMGIDKSDVRLVVHFTMAGSLEDYYQEAGRAGRDGRASRCVMLFHPRDRGVHQRFLERSHPEPAIVRTVFEAMSRDRDERGVTSADPRRIASRCRPRLTPALTGRSIELLARDHLLIPAERHAQVRVRLLATPFRVSHEMQALSAAAQSVLRAAAGHGTGSWLPLSAMQLSLEKSAFRCAIEELESRQLLFRERAAPSATVNSGAAANARLERTLHSLIQRRRAEHAKLDAMVGYGATHRCRRGYLLRYFGDDSVREPCARCDNCNA